MAPRQTETQPVREHDRPIVAQALADLENQTYAQVSQRYGVRRGKVYQWAVTHGRRKNEARIQVSGMSEHGGAAQTLDALNARGLMCGEQITDEGLHALEALGQAVTTRPHH